MANSYTKNYQDGTALTEAQLDTAFTSFTLGLDKTTNMTAGATDGYVLTSTGSGNAAAFEALPNPTSIGKIQNLRLNGAASAGALTISVKTNAASDPTSTDKVAIDFSDASSSAGTISQKEITSALSITINASATLGFTTTAANVVFIYGLKNSTANVALGVSAMGHLDQQSQSVTLVSASADSKTTVYSSISSAASNSLRLLGYITAALNSSKQWQSPSEVRLDGMVAINNTVNADRVGTSMSSTGANAIAASRVRSAATTVGIGGVAVSPQSGAFFTTSTTFVDVTNLSVTLTTSGRPVMVFLASADSANSSLIGTSIAGASTQAEFAILRDGSILGRATVAAFAGGVTSVTNQAPPGSLSYLDTPVSGTYTYKVQARNVTSGGTAFVYRSRLVVYEL